MAWISPTQLLLLAMAIPLFLAGLVAWLIDPAPRATSSSEPAGATAADPSVPSGSSEQVPPTGT